MKIKKKHLNIGLVLLAIVILIAAAHYYIKAKDAKNQNTKNPQEPDTSSEKMLWSVDTDGYLHYPLDRGTVKFRRDDYSKTNSSVISKVIFESNRGNIYGLLVLPKNISEPLPGVVLLPGAGVSKESELNLAKRISELGAAVLTIDQRGVGETGGIFPTLDQDYASFLKAQEPYQHLMVYDALRAYDLLKSAPFIDPDRIIIAGESLGGRIAIIAVSIDRKIKGALVISSSGFDFKGIGDPKKDIFLKSIDSDRYIESITPRKLVMMHNMQDKIIPLSSAIKSYSKAQEPKRLVLMNETSCNHGYCDSMYQGLVESLDFLDDIGSKTIFSVKT